MMNPFDANAECRYCDEQAMHRADCEWLLNLIAACEDVTEKLHLIIDWADRRGLLYDHGFTFPDGDFWEARSPAEVRERETASE